MIPIRLKSNIFSIHPVSGGENDAGSGGGGEPTGSAQGFFGDVAATAKRDLLSGEILDGEGGFTVYGILLPARKSISSGYLPIGLAHGVKLNKPIAAGEMIRWDDVVYDGQDETVHFRLEMEAAFKKEWSGQK